MWWFVSIRCLGKKEIVEWRHLTPQSLARGRLFAWKYIEITFSHIFYGLIFDSSTLYKPSYKDGDLVQQFWRFIGKHNLYTRHLCLAVRKFLLIEFLCFEMGKFFPAHLKKLWSLRGACWAAIDQWKVYWVGWYTSCQEPQYSFLFLQ